MAEVQMLFPMEPKEFWRQLKAMLEELVEQKSSSTIKQHSPTDRLLKAKEVCSIFQVSKPTIYEWLKQGKLKSIKIESRMYFLWEDIEELIRKCKSVPDQKER